MGIYLVMFIISFSLIITAHFLKKTSQNFIFGVRTTATLADAEIWEIVNKKASYVFYFLGNIFIILDVFFWLSGYEEDLFGMYLLISFGITVVFVGIYLVLYSNNLLKKKNKGLKIIPEIILPKYFLYIIEIAVISILTCGILMLFIGPNSFLGIRIGKTLSDPILWKKVNTISGIGFASISLLFTFIFFNIAKKEDAQRTKLFERNFVVFIILILVWGFVSAGLAYLM